MIQTNQLSTNSKIIQIVFFKPPRKIFDYVIDSSHFDNNQDIIGLRVLAPFGKRNIVGIIVNIIQQSTLAINKLKNIIKIIDHKPIFSTNTLKLFIWVSEYYHVTIGEIFNVALPPKLKTDHICDLSSIKNPKKYFPSTTASITAIPPKHILNAAQEHAKQVITRSLSKFNVFLLDGVTGSGKTEVYLQIVEEVIASGKQALVLVPEINLTPQTIKRFNQRFPQQVMAYHSDLTPTEKLCSFLLAKENLISVIIGTRSAAWLPFNNLGVFIIDEEHDLSFKQQEGFRYSARDVLIKRAQIEKIPIILGSATPALETLHNCNQGKYTHLLLPNRAGEANLPAFSVIDTKQSKPCAGLTKDLIVKIQNCLDKKEQILLFLNRRGFAQVLICHECGWFKKCKSCDARMIIHLNTWKLHCHHCLIIEPIPKFCPSCKQSELDPLGIGTERVEDYLRQLFPIANIARVDKDTIANKHAMEKIYTDVNNNLIDILVGTQMLAKGHHFSNITLVAILDIDNGLFGADFRATEKLGQLFTQVSGRSGRGTKIGEVVLQTCYPTHPLLQLLIENNYAKYCVKLIAEREQLSLPPFSFQALFRAQSRNSKLAMEFLIWIKDLAKKIKIKNLQILGPIPAPMAKKVGFYRTQLLIEATERSHLHILLNNLMLSIREQKLSNNLHWSIDIDPQDMY
jgi:primosomal protein N' (replication factor Y) (superfamily II helicase)